MRQRFLHEKQREDRLRRHVTAVARWGWREAMTADPLGLRLSRAGLPLVRPRNERMLATLASHPRSIPRTGER